MITLAVCVSLLFGLLIAGGALIELAEDGKPVPLGAIVFWGAFAVTWPAMVALGLAALLILCVLDLIGGPR